MYRIIFLIMIFLLVIYIYTFMKIRKNRKKRETELSFTDQYHQKYSAGKTQEKHIAGQYYSKSRNIQNYVTKYNSHVDYIEKK